MGSLLRQNTFREHFQRTIQRILEGLEGVECQVDDILVHGNYLLVIDYRSRYVEVSALLSSQTSREIIRGLKSIFARHGVPEVVRSDNGPQFDSAEFAKFAKEWEFEHVTGSPRYAQSNGEVGKSIQTLETLLKKEDDPVKVLIAYRSTPLECGYSPAQLLFGRNLRTTVPTIPMELTPKWPDLTKLKMHEEEKKQVQADYFNSRPRTRSLKELLPGQQVWVQDMKEPAITVPKTPLPRPYVVETEAGTSLRRNRLDLIPITPTTASEVNPPETSTSTSRMPVHPPTSPRPVTVTRSGRHVRPPVKLNLQDGNKKTLHVYMIFL